MNIAICDDDVKFSDKLNLMLNKYLCENDNVYIFDNGLNLLEAEINLDFEIVFLDIEMPICSGFKVAECLQNEKIKVIFVSDYNDKVYSAIKYSPFRFLRKENIDVELEEAVTSALSAIALGNKSIIINIRDEKRKINVIDIFYVEAVGRKLKIKLKDEAIELPGTLKILKGQLPENIFANTHRSYIVNLGKVKLIDANFVVLGENMKIPVSRNNKKALKNLFMNYVRRNN